MNRSTRFRGVAVTLLALALPWCGPAFAQEDKKPEDKGWQDTAELSYVLTSGNSDTKTLGFKNKLWREWERSSFELKAGGVRAESTTTEWIAFGVPSDYNVDKNETTDLTAEAYYLNGRYDHKITEAFFWFGQGGWERNRFAGLDNRYSAVGGVGNVWVDTDRLKFRTDYALSYTKQEDVVEDPNVSSTFLGARFSWAYLHKFGQNTTYTNDFVVDENLDDTSDVRLDMTNGVAVSMNSHLALKVALQLIYDNVPSLIKVDLFDAPGGTKTGTVLAELDELDSIFTTSLVINF